MRYVVSISCLLIALTLYVTGASTGAGLAFLVGALFELGFWKSLFARKQAPQATHADQPAD